MPVIDAAGCPIHVEVEGPRARAGADAVQFARHHPAHVGSRRWSRSREHFRLVRYDRARPRQVRRAQGPLHDGAARPRRARDHGRARDQEGELVRPFDGRHGRALARRQCAGAHRPADPVQHVKLLCRQDALERPHQVRCATKGIAAVADRVWNAGSPRTSSEREPDEAAHDDSRCSLATPLDGYIACCEAVRDMDHRELLPKITAPTLVIAGAHDPATNVGRRRIHPQPYSRRQHRRARRRAYLQRRAAASLYARGLGIPRR